MPACDHDRERMLAEIQQLKYKLVQEKVKNAQFKRKQELKNAFKVADATSNSVSEVNLLTPANVPIAAEAVEPRRGGPSRGRSQPNSQVRSWAATTRGADNFDTAEVHWEGLGGSSRGKGGTKGKGVSTK